MRIRRELRGTCLVIKRLGFLSLFLLAGALLISGSPAYADTMLTTPSTGTSDGFGSSFVLTADCVGNLCTVTLTIDTTGVSGTACSGTACSDISNVAFKIGTTDILTGSLTAPTASWSTITSSLQNAGCTGGNSDGQICSSALADFADTGGVLTWTWTGVQVSGDLSIGHVGYKYDTSDTLGNGNIVSIDFGGTTTVPEPRSLSLLGIGLLGLAVVARKFAQA
jgi:PEP-CTERM motif-containing protein